MEITCIFIWFSFNTDNFWKIDKYLATGKSAQKCCRKIELSSTNLPCLLPLWLEDWQVFLLFLACTKHIRKQGYIPKHILHGLIMSLKMQLFSAHLPYKTICGRYGYFCMSANTFDRVEAFFYLLFSSRHAENTCIFHRWSSMEEDMQKTVAHSET